MDIKLLQYVKRLWNDRWALFHVFMHWGQLLNQVSVEKYLLIYSFERAEATFLANLVVFEFALSNTVGVVVPWLHKISKKQKDRRPKTLQFQNCFHYFSLKILYGNQQHTKRCSIQSKQTGMRLDEVPTYPREMKRGETSRLLFIFQRLIKHNSSTWNRRKAVSHTVNIWYIVSNRISQQFDSGKLCGCSGVLLNS